MSKKVTMDDIANELNVSRSLVSRAIADKYGVSDEMKNKIKLTALKMGYNFTSKHKNEFQRVESITLVVESADLLDSGFWVRIIDSIEKELNRRLISVFLSVFQDEHQEKLPVSIKQMKTQGAIILGRVPMKHILAVSVTGLPIVLVDSMYSNLKFDQVMANNYQGCYDATDFILKQGHQNIGFVGSAQYSYSFRERLRGFNDCIASNTDRQIITHHVVNEHDSDAIPFSRKAFFEMMNSSTVPTALVCANDPVAFHVYELLEEMGKKILRMYQ